MFSIIQGNSYKSFGFICDGALLKCVSGKKKNKKERHEIFPVLATIAKQLQIRLIMKEENRLIFCTIQLDLRVNNHKMHLLSALLV